jgi:hypothetical protein
MATEPPLLAASLIVKDEEASLPDCLACLVGVVDETVVYDTGSRDATRDIARSAGATVIEGRWDDDFARARNASLAAVTASWFLAVDADERLRADGPELHARLAAASDERAFLVRVDNAAGPGAGRAYSLWAPRLYRRDGARWTGRVHERVEHERPGPEGELPADLITIAHLGYADAATLHAKAVRNTDLARQTLTEALAHEPEDVSLVAAAALDLGRSLINAGDQQGAVEAFEAVRQLVSGGSTWAQATDFLARLLLADGQDEVVLLLAEQLRTGGADGRYCDWLRAQALAQLGQPAEALALLEGIDRLFAPGSREFDAAQVDEARELLRAITRSPA